MNLPRFVSTPDGPMVEGASPELLRELLVQVVEETVRWGADVEHAFQPPLPEVEVRRQLAEVGLECPEELIVWFGWHNGYAPSYRGSPERPLALPNFPMASLESAIFQYRDLREDIFFEGIAAGADGLGGCDSMGQMIGADVGWLQLVDSNWGLTVECASIDSPRIHYASENFWYEESPRYRAVSLSTYVAWWLYNLKSGAYSIDPRFGLWVADVERVATEQREALFW